MATALARGRLLGGLAVTIILVGGCSNTSPTSPPPSSSTMSAAPFGTGAEPAFAEALRSKLYLSMAHTRTPGAIVLVDVPGQGTWSEGLGVADIHTNAAMRPDNHMRVGSITKTLTATVILGLVDEHKIGLNDPVAKYLPQVPNGANITIRQLLDMRSGLFNTTEDDRLNQVLDAQPQKIWTNDELMAIAFAYPPYFPPGQGYHYCNTNYELLATIAEQIGGAPLAQLMRQRIFDPLGMHDTLLPARDSAAIPEPHARGYEWGSNVAANNAYKAVVNQDVALGQVAVAPGELPRDATDWTVSYTYGSGAVISTAHDLAIWAKALVTGQLLSPQTQQQRLMLQAPDNYGLGVESEFGLIGHNGAVPGFQSFMGYNPDKAVTVIVLANSQVAPNTFLGEALPADALAHIIQQQVCPECVKS